MIRNTIQYTVRIICYALHSVTFVKRALCYLLLLPMCVRAQTRNSLLVWLKNGCPHDRFCTHTSTGTIVETQYVPYKYIYTNGGHGCNSIEHILYIKYKTFLHTTDMMNGSW